MAYLALLWKARTIEKYRQKYEKEKINSVNSDKTELRSSLYEKWTVYQNDSQKKLGEFCTNCCPEGSKLANFCTLLKENSSCLLKIVIGMVGGIFTYFLYKIFVFQDSAWTVFSWIAGLAIILGVTLSYRVRCLVLLLVPGLFSRVGRYTLACYALVLILTGPAANTLKNLDALSASLACGQEQIKSSVKEIKEAKDSPLNLVKETISSTVEQIEYLAAAMQEMMVVVHRLTMSIAHVLQSSLSWLNYVETICNAKLGTPYEHCIRIFAEGKEDCQARLPEFSRQWNWDLIVQSVCFTLKPADSLCVVGDFAKGSIVATVQKKLKTFSNRIQSLLNMRLHIRRSHSVCANGSLPVNPASAGVVTDLRNRADTLLAWLSWTCALTGLFLMLIIFRAKYYLLMFRTRSRFDNRYVTKELRELDLKRRRQGRETVLPLNTRERAKYVSTASFRLLPSERTYLTRSIVFMVITTLKLMIHMVADYSLYWVLMNVRFHGRDQCDFQRVSASNRAPPIAVSGSGPLAGAARALAAALPAPRAPPASGAACLPDPNPPDLRRYAQIGSLILLLWLLALFEPYGLRLRHVISAHYQPERAKARAVWLYYHIIRTRSCFLKFARRKLHRQFKYMSEEKLTFKRWLHDCIPCNWLRTLLRVGPADPHCLLCYTKHRQDDLDRHLKRCETSSCPGVYCARCFTDIGQLCTICYSPEDYGDLSDVSLEKFTSDDSTSDSSDDDDKRPLMRRSDKNEQDGNGTLSNPDKKNKRDPLFISKHKNGDEESQPLLDGDYLKKDYTQQGIIKLKCNNNMQTPVDVSTQEVVSELDANNIDVNRDNVTNENMTNNILQHNSLSDKRSRLRMVFSDTEVTVNGIKFPKGKLAAIVTTMMFLTSKDEKYVKYRNEVTKRNKPFEYLVMEMFQPSVIFQRIVSARRIKSTTGRSFVTTQNIQEPFNSDIRKLIKNPVYENKLKSSPTHCKTELQTDFNFKNTESVLKYVQSDSQNKHEIKKLSKQVKNLRYSKRKVKRFLDLKKTITNILRENLSNSLINYNIYKFTSKRRRRSNQHYKRLKIISTVCKVFRNKLINYEGLHSLQQILYLNEEENKPPILMKKTMKRKNPNKSYTRTFPDQANQVSQDECSVKNNMQHLSGIVTGDIIYTKSIERISDEYPSKDTDENNCIKTESDPENKTVEVETHQKKHKKPGFWESLRLRRRRNHSSRLFFGVSRDDPSFYNFFANHKRRRKPQINAKVNKNNTTVSNVNDDVQSNKVGICIKAESNRNMSNYNGISDLEKNKLSERDCKRTEERGFLEYRDMKDAKHEISSRRSNEGETKKMVFKATSTEGKEIANIGECKVRSAREFLILYEDKCDEITHEPSGKLSNLSRKLKNKFSQIALIFPKRNKRIQSVVFTEIHLKGSEPNLNEDKPLPYQDICLNDDSWDLETESEKNVDLQGECQEDKTREASHTERKPLDECDINREIQLRTSCFHAWRVKPKKQKECQIKGSNEESFLHGSSQNMIGRCFQIKPEEKVNITDMSLRSFKNSKRTEIRDTYSCDETENHDDSKIKERQCKLEHVCVANQRTQTPRGYIAKHIESCVPMYHAAVQSSDMETEKTNTTFGASKYLRPLLKPYKGKIIKEVTERLIWPLDSTCSHVTLEYADETTPKLKTRGHVTLTSNRSTTTRTRTVADVSTTTSDWWSPILERKSLLTTRGDIKTENNEQEDKDLEAANEWGSSFLIDDAEGILSASNYLMQSERYAQIYSMGRSPSRGPRPRRRNAVSEKPSFNYHHLRKGPKTNRLKKSHSSRKKMLSSSNSINLAPPKWRPVVAEAQAHALKYYKHKFEHVDGLY